MLRAVGLLIVGLAVPALAEVRTDGTAGPRVALAGPDYDIGADLGTRAGPNLFHSFERFSLAAGERATFFGPAQIRNIISRVTGGERSDIDGTLRSTVPGADFYFINPAGVMFGPNARLDLQGSFHVSTADELRFTDGTRFRATNPASSFTVAAPSAFGFLGARDRAPILVDRSTLTVPAGTGLSLVGGDITIDGGNNGAASGGEQGLIRAEAGRITVAALSGPGSVALAGDDPVPAAMADIRLKDQALVDASGDGGGAIRIRSGRFIASNRSFVFADNAGGTDAADGITLAAEAVTIASESRLTTDAFASGDAGPLAVRAGRVVIAGGGLVRSATAGSGEAGAVTVEAGGLEIRGGSRISSDTFADGDAGSVNVTADRLLVSGSETALTRISSDAVSGSGDAGAVFVAAGDLLLRSGGEITSSTFAGGDAGSVTVEVGRARIVGDGQVFLTGIMSAAAPFSTGDAGAVTVRAGDLELRGGGSGAVITSNSVIAEGNAGTVTVEAERLLIDGHSSEFQTGITSLAGLASGGDGGTVTVRAADLELRRGGQIGSDTRAAGNAGAVIVEAERLRIIGDGSGLLTGITSAADPGSAGAGGIVMVSAADLELRGGEIGASTAGAGPGGLVLVTADHLRIFAAGAGGPSGIRSVSAGGPEARAGNVLVAADDLEINGVGAEISASSGGSAVAGSVVVSADVLTLIDGGSIASLNRGSGEAGSVTIQVSDSLRSDGGSVTARAAEADAGNILIVAARLVDLEDSEITTSAAAGRGSGGNIVIDPEFVVLDNSRIVAEAAQGRGGIIAIMADNLVRSHTSEISAASGVPALGGTIVISAPEADLSGGLVALEGAIVDTPKLPARCGARRDIGASSFTRGRRGGLPPSPDGPLAGSSFAAPPAPTAAGSVPAAGSPFGLAPRCAPAS